MSNCRIKLEDAKKIFSVNIGRTLVGVYHIIDKSITLFPCMDTKVRLYEDANGVFIKGFKITSDDINGEKLSEEELAECNHFGYVPRFVELSPGTTNILTGNSFLVSHEYATRLMKITDLKILANLRGFSVIQKTTESEPHFDWKSGSLNSPRDSEGKIIERIKGCEMIYAFQREIEEIVKSWRQSLTRADSSQCFFKPINAGQKEQSLMNSNPLESKIASETVRLKKE